MLDDAFTVGEEAYKSRAEAQFYQNEVNRMEDTWEAPTMGHPCGQSQQEPIFIRTNENKTFRVYFRGICGFSGGFKNKLCRFLDTRTEDQTVSFIVGSTLSDTCAHMVGPIISAMTMCRAKVNVIAAGCCSIPETMLWVFAKDGRGVMRYGALNFGITDIVRACEAYSAYFDNFLAKSIELGVLTAEDVADLKESHAAKMVLFQDLAKLCPKYCVTH